MITRAALAVVLTAGSAMGAIAQTVDQQTHWNDAVLWGGTAPTSDNDYTSNMMLRSYSSSSGAFAGRSLTMLTGGTLALRNNSPVNELHMAGGTITHLAKTVNLTLSGNVYIDANTTINLNSATANTYCAAILHGNHTITVTNGNTTSVDSKLTLKGNNADFSGDWIITNNAKVVASVAGALGTGNIQVDATGILDLDYALNNASASLVLNGKMILDQNLTFGSVTIANQSLEAGTYSFAQLNSLYDANFDDTGSGSITVAAAPAPEPSALGLLAAGAAGMLMRRRK